MDFRLRQQPPFHNPRPMRRPLPQTLEVHTERCTACGACVDVCMFDALEVEDTVSVDTDRCCLCGACVVTCPEEAIVWKPTSSP